MNEPELEKLRKQLRVMAEADAKRVARPAVEAALLAAFREQAGRKQSRRVVAFPRSWAVWTAVGTAAAALAWVAVRPAAPDSAVPTIAPRAPQVASVLAPRPVVTPSAPQPAVRAATPVAQRKRRPPTAAPQRNGGVEVATSFYALSPGIDDADIEGLPAVRVRVPRTTLASFGLPVDVNRLQQPVKADLVLGEDGMARAIRFISSPADQGM